MIGKHTNDEKKFRLMRNSTRIPINFGKWWNTSKQCLNVLLTSQYCRSSHRTTSKTKNPCPVPRIEHSIRARTWKIREWRNVKNEGSWTGRNGMGPSICVCSKRGWSTHNWMCYYKLDAMREQIATHTQNAKDYWFTWRCINLLYFGR